MGGVCTYNDVLVDRITFSEESPPTQTELWIDALVDWELGATDVYVDDQWVGNTNYCFAEATVSPGYHTVEVDAYAGGCTFRYFVGYAEEENPITVYFPQE